MYSCSIKECVCKVWGCNGVHLTHWVMSGLSSAKTSCIIRSNATSYVSTRMQMPRYQHPLLYEKHALLEEQLRLACCCLCECSKQLEGPRLCAVWKKVEEQPAANEGSSNSYTTDSQNLGAAPLFPRFRDAASRQDGLWACIACVRERVKEAAAAVNAATDPAAPPCKTDPAVGSIPHGLIQLISQHPTDSQAQPSQQHQPHSNHRQTNPLSNSHPLSHLNRQTNPRSSSHAWCRPGMQRMSALQRWRQRQHSNQISSRCRHRPVLR